MPKKYEYFIVLTKQDSQFPTNRTIFETFDHEITSKDISAINDKFEGKCFLDETYSVTNFKLLKVTGTFTYRVFYEIRESLCTPIYSSRLCILDHKITTNSYDEDMHSIYNQIREHLQDRQQFQIFSFQEIPDE